MPNDKAKELTARELIALERGERTFKESLKVELRQCPFCGNKEISAEPYPDIYGSASCLYCGSGTQYKELKDAIETWNTRPIEDALQARITELEHQLETAKAHAVVWHKYPDEKPPIDGRYLFWDSDGNAPHVLPYNDIVVRNNPGVFSTQTHWAYLPAPPEDE